ALGRDQGLVGVAAGAQPLFPTPPTGSAHLKGRRGWGAPGGRFTPTLCGLACTTPLVTSIIITFRSVARSRRRPFAGSFCGHLDVHRCPPVRGSTMNARSLCALETSLTCHDLVAPVELGGLIALNWSIR